MIQNVAYRKSTSHEHGHQLPDQTFKAQDCTVAQWRFYQDAKQRRPQMIGKAACITFTEKHDVIKKILHSRSGLSGESPSNLFKLDLKLHGRMPHKNFTSNWHQMASVKPPTPIHAPSRTCTACFDWERETHKYFRRWLEKGYDCSSRPQLHKIAETADYLEGGGTVKPSGNLVLQQVSTTLEYSNIPRRYCHSAVEINSDPGHGQNWQQGSLCHQERALDILNYTSFVLSDQNQCSGPESTAQSGNFLWLCMLQVAVMSAAIDCRLTMNKVLLGPATISPVVTRFFWPPLMPLIIWLPTCRKARAHFERVNQVTGCTALQTLVDKRVTLLQQSANIVSWGVSRVCTNVSAQTPSPRMWSTYSVSIPSRFPSMAFAFMKASISGSGLMPFSFSKRRSS